MTELNGLEFRKLDKEGLQTLVQWAEHEGWNPGMHDADVFYATDPDGFVGCFRDGAMIGGGSVVSYNGDFGFMGFFIVKPEYRASGIGRELWYRRRDMLLARLKAGAPIGMDGVVAMQPFYSKGGFEIAFRDERHERVGEVYDTDSRVTPINDDDMAGIIAYDAPCFGCERQRFLRPWLAQADARTFKFTEDGVLKGYALARKVIKGYKIGPLFADNAIVAEELYRACLNAATGEPVYIDVPMINTNAVALTKKYNTTYVFECARMYYGTAPVLQTDKVYGITSFELG